MAVKLKAGGLRGQTTDPSGDRWYVTDGMNAVGPVDLDLLARGVEAGRVPLDSFVRNERWKVWRPLTDFTEAEGDAAASIPSLVHTGPLSALLDALADERSSEAADRQTIEIGSEAIPTLDPGSLEVAPPNSSPEEEIQASDILSSETVDIPAPKAPVAAGAASPRIESTQLSRDLLGADRPTLASYLDDDEETIVPRKPSVAGVVRGGPASIPPPRPGSIPPVHIETGRGNETGRGPISSAPQHGSRPPMVGAASISSAPARPASAHPLSPQPLSAPMSAPPLSAPPSVPPSAESSTATATANTGRPASLPPPPAPPAVASPRSPSVAPPNDEHATARISLPPATVPPSSGWSPADELASAKDLSDALLLLLTAVVRRAPAEVGLVHKMADDGATVVCAHGPNGIDLLGTRARLLDPAIVAAAGGNIVIAEPAPGPAGDATLARMRKVGIDCEGAVMFPLRPRGRLLGFLEIGKAERFGLRGILRAEDLVRAFVTKAETLGWIA